MIYKQVSCWLSRKARFVSIGAVPSLAVDSRRGFILTSRVGVVDFYLTAHGVALLYCITAVRGKFKNWPPCRFLNVNFGKAKISLLLFNTAGHGAVEQHTSVYAVQRQVFLTEKLASALHHRRPWQVQKLTSLSIFEREFWQSKNIATAGNHRRPWRFSC